MAETQLGKLKMGSYEQNDKKDEDYEKNIIRPGRDIQKLLYLSVGLHIDWPDPLFLFLSSLPSSAMRK